MKLVLTFRTVVLFLVLKIKSKIILLTLQKQTQYALQKRKQYPFTFKKAKPSVAPNINYF